MRNTGENESGRGLGGDVGDNIPASGISNAEKSSLVKLTPKERKFLKAYFKTFNARKSYRYITTKDISNESADSLGSRLLARIKKKLPGRIFSNLPGLMISALLVNLIFALRPRKQSFTKGSPSQIARITVLACVLLSCSLTFADARKTHSTLTRKSQQQLSAFSSPTTAVETVPSRIRPMPDIRPQSGPQEHFLASSADIAIYGGAAGGGKTFSLLMEPLRHIDNHEFGAVYFRRSMPQITAQGSAWDKAHELYGPLGATLIQSPNHVAEFPSGSRVGFHHLQYDDTVHDWQSSQIALILFDELTQFTKRQFFYMLSRNRSTCGVRSYVRAACNPDPDSWVRAFIAWWIDEESGLPILERSGVIRWFVRVGDDISWGDSREELVDRFGADVDPLSVTFIPASVYDNKALLAKDPGYLAKLKALPRWEREQLLGGNWNSRASAGMIFARTDFEIVDAAPADIVGRIRYWDRAATEQSEASPDPDWTAGVYIFKAFSGVFYIADVSRFRARPFVVKQNIKTTASQDGRSVAIGIEQDPGQAGVSEAEDLVRDLAGYNVKAFPARQDKVTRWKPLSAQAQSGNVKLLRGPWNDAFIDELCALTDNPKDYGHDDQADAAAGGFNALTSSPPADPRVGSALAARRSRP